MMTISDTIPHTVSVSVYYSPGSEFRSEKAFKVLAFFEWISRFVRKKKQVTRIVRQQNTGPPYFLVLPYFCRNLILPYFFANITSN